MENKVNPTGSRANMNPIKVLFLASNPKQTQPLDLGKEIREIKNKIQASQNRDYLEFEKAWAVRFDELIQNLNEYKPHIVHFSGHGSNTGEIILLDKYDQPQAVSTEAIKELFSTVSKDNIKVVLWNACYSKTIGEAIAEFIDCVIGMNTAINDQAAIDFAATFYGAIAAKRSVQQAFTQAKAVLMTSQISEEKIPELIHREQINPEEIILVSDREDNNNYTINFPENLPYSGVVKFVGRQNELTNLHEKLQQTERIAITSITGMGGIGKTELALQYSIYHCQQKTYLGGICWLNALDTNVGIEIVNFGKAYLNLNPPDNSNLETQVQYCWRNWQPPEGKVLVIFDDVAKYDQIKPYLPPNNPRFKVLITTRIQGFIGFQELALNVLDEAAALELLTSLVGDRIETELETAKTLCADLGYLPLGLELIGRYLNGKPDLSLAKMRERLKLEHRSLNPEDSQEMTAKRGVKAAFELSWKELKPEEQELACGLSLLALAPIPWSLVESCFPEIDEEDLEDWRDDKLVKLNLLQRVEENTYQFHPLIQEFLKTKLEEFPSQVDEWKRSICQAIAAVAKEIPKTPTRNDILAVTLTIPHIEEVAENLTNYLTDEDLIQPFIGLGRFYEGQGFYSQAEPWYENFLNITQNRLGQQHPDVATSLNNLANLYYSQGKYEEAEPLYQQALEMYRQLLGQQHPYVATSLKNLASLYKSQGKYEEAEPLYQQALEMYRQLLGQQHPDVANSLNNLAGLYYSQGKYEEAEPLYLQALEMRRQLLGQQHPSVANSLNNLASLYKSQGKYEEAEPLYQQALEMRRQLLGQQHPDVATSLNNLASLYYSQGKYEQAEPLSQQALEMYRQLLGQQHPYVATSLNNLAYLYSSQGKYEEAEPLYLQALEMRRQLLGQQHPSVAHSLNDLALLYQHQGKYEEAEPLYLQALEMRRQLLGQQHPSVAHSLNDLASLYYSQGKYEQAEPLYLEALSIRETVLGVDHPHTKQTQENLDRLLELKGRGARPCAPTDD
ncbi:FxSxx-COOH system tetratricopeptide repeat protein [Limnoraphis robusta]|uniref:FxSxx-COOH system tetratricopeptide repeat protein n=1 Tax=Limnoraphis robusta TaxID=1118279 RepID=UPI002B219D8F|nr:FxSxx-COOH system tetratricopeptide repeat protein [Limnoraphis robusta]MEA5499578.1 FxSxx-COOH system tetratricopeptide repeat protein [Limnoraphis robusta BA-68 BA1]